MATFDTLVLLCQLLALEPSAYVYFQEGPRYFHLKVNTPGASCEAKTSFWAGGEAEYVTKDTHLKAQAHNPKPWSEYKREG